MIQNDRILNVLAGKPVDRLPVWLMRQAGRYLPEYRALREEAGSFWALCKTPDLAAEAAMQPITRYDLDAAILFSDILTIPEAMGMNIDFIESKGPVFQNPLRNEQQINALPLADINHLGYVFDAVLKTKQRLNQKIPLIGFSGSPFTLACYMVEGQGSRDFLSLRRLLADRADLAHRLMEKLAQSIIQYLSAQIAAGVDLVMLFDTWGSILDKESYSLFSLAYLKKIVDAIKASYPDIPVLLYAKGAAAHCLSIAETKFDGISLDWTADLSHVRQTLADYPITLQGNLDPAILSCHSDVISHKVRQMIDAAGTRRYIANLGHGIPLDTPIEGVQHFIDAIRSYPLA